MALKDWNKAGANAWTNAEILERLYINKVNNTEYEILLVEDEEELGESGDYQTIKTFKNKVAALKFVKSYMRKN